MYKLSKLRNGLTLITSPVKGTKTMTVLVIVGTGSKYETRDNNGISHFLEHMFFKGTAKRPTTLAISGELDSVGAEFNAFTSKEYTGYYVKADAGKADLALDVVSDILLNSKFDADEIEREKGVITEEINMYYDNPMMYIEDLFEQVLYGDTPAGWDTAGTKENVARFKRADFLDYFNSQYQPLNSIICLSGHIDAAMIKKIERHFAEFAAKHKQKDFQAKPAVKTAQSGPAIKVFYKDTDQAHLSLGVHAYPYAHKDELSAKLLGIILGGSMSSRLFTEVRERRGLAYYVRTHSEPYTDAGYVTTQAGVRVDKIEEVIKVILAEYSKLTRELVPAEELRRVKDLIKGRIVIQLEASDDVAEWYGRQAVLKLTQAREGEKGAKREKMGRKGGRGGEIITPEEFFRQVEKVKAEDIRKVAREIFVTSKLNLAMIGPFRDEKKFSDLLKL
jgi:predicted Zn-dependent peptidase